MPAVRARATDRDATSLDTLAAAMRLIHVFPSVTVVIASTLLIAVAHHGIPPLDVLLRGAGVVAGSQIAVGSLNDYVDRSDDAITQPTKPLASGIIVPEVALAMTAAGILACLVLAATFGAASLCLAAVGLASGVAYDLRLKRTPFSPLCYVVSFLSLVTWIWNAVGALSPHLLLLYPPGACLLLAANVANALPDSDSDRSLGQRGLAVLLGTRNSVRLVLTVSLAGAGTALALSVLLRSPAGAAIAVLSLGLGTAALWASLRFPKQRSLYVLIFRLVAPAIVCTALATVLALYAVL